MYTPRLNWFLFILFAIAAIGVFAAALLLPPFREIAYAPLLQILQTEQAELKEFDAELEKTSMV
jgi:hypothetical protein